MNFRLCCEQLQLPRLVYTVQTVPHIVPGRAIHIAVFGRGVLLKMAVLGPKPRDSDLTTSEWDLDISKKTPPQVISFAARAENHRQV